MTAMPLTRPQQRVLDAVEAIGADGWPVTVREVCDWVGLASPSTAHSHLCTLEQRGLLVKHPRNPQGGWRCPPRP